MVVVEAPACVSLPPHWFLYIHYLSIQDGGRSVPLRCQWAKFRPVWVTEMRITKYSVFWTFPAQDSALWISKELGGAG